MPNFATAADLNRPTPRAAEGVATYRTPRIPLDQGEGAQALYEQGQQTKELAASAEKFAETMNESVAQDALNKLRQKRLEMTIDPEKGFTRLKGDQVRGTGPGGQPWLKELDGDFQRATDEIGANLKLSPGAYGLYKKAADREALGFKTDVVKHFVDQSEKYEAAVYKDTLTSTLADAAQSYSDPAKLEVLAERAATAADNRARQTGLPSQAREARSNVLRVGVESLLASGNNRQALAYFESVKSRLDGPDAVALQSRMKSVASEVTGETAANEALVGQGLSPTASDDKSVLSYGAKVRQHESGGAYSARNPDTNASGAYQFIDSTWVTSARKFLPDQTQGMTDAEALKLRNDPKAQDVVFGGFTRDNELALAKAGVPVNDATRYLAHWFGAQGAINLVKADPNAPIEQFLPAGKSPTGKTWAEANGIAGKSVGQVLAIAGQRMGEPAAFGTPGAYKGDIVSAYQKAASDVASRTDLNATEKAKALALITQQRTQTEGIRTATVKSLDDYSQTIITTAMLNPSAYKDGALLDIAQRYDAVGEGAKATRFRLLAAMEGPLKTFATTASEGQRTLLGSVLEGLPKQIAEGLKKGDSEAKAQARLRAGDLFSQAKESFGKGIAPEGLAATLKEAATLYASIGDEERVRQVQDFYQGAYTAHAANQQPTTGAQQTLADLKALTDKAGATALQLQTHSLMQETYDRQQAALKADTLAAGARIYKDVGPLEPIDWTSPQNIWAGIDLRNTQALKVQSLSGNAAVPFTNEEIERLRGVLNAGAPEQQRNLLRNLGRTVHNELLTSLAVKLAGKDDDIASAYASALARYGEGDPTADGVADKILMGAQIMKNGGEAGRKPASTSDAWLTELQDKLGNALALHMTGKVPAELAAAIKAHYVAGMWSAGKQGEKTDTDQLDKSIQAVTGGIITYRGQQLFAPGPNATSYDIDAALRTLAPGDVPTDLRTQEGDQVTAEAIKRNGRLLSVGAGTYAVRIPDPRAGGDLRPIIDPRTGQAFVLDLRPLLERTKSLPTVDTNPMGFGAPTP